MLSTKFWIGSFVRNFRGLPNFLFAPIITILLLIYALIILLDYNYLFIRITYFFNNKNMYTIEIIIVSNIRQHYHFEYKCI